MEGVTVTGLAALVALFTVNAVQFIKPFVELIPGIDLAKNKQVHDNLLRLLQIGINLGATALLAISVPVYRGIPWWQIVLIGLGQATGSHLTYVNSNAGSGSASASALPDPVAVLANNAPALEDSIPTVPRP